MLFRSWGVGSPRPFYPNAEQNVRQWFDRLRQLGALQYVRYLYPTDEPNLPAHDVCGTLGQAIALLKRVAADYPELKGVRYAVIYFHKKAFCGIGDYDVIAFDDYKGREGILNPGARYDTLLDTGVAGQSTMLVPGGYQDQPVGPFLNFALNNPEVEVLLPFLWCSPPPGAETLVGIRDRGVRQQYMQAGYQILNTNNPYAHREFGIDLSIANLKKFFPSLPDNETVTVTDIGYVIGNHRTTNTHAQLGLNLSMDYIEIED